MKLLLDTHALLWWQVDDPQLGAAARRHIADADEVLVSDASIWEISIKIRVGKLRIDLVAVRRAMRDDGFGRLAIRPEHFDRLLSLPVLHRDPFDHLLIAQAIEESATLMTADFEVARYPVPTLACN